MLCVAQPVQLSWRDLSYSIKSQQVLRPNSGGFSRGMWCMLGPSGAGKSTLLGVLAGRKRVGRLRGEALA
jgi:ABC-type multidrug transport system ATPase subunit